MGESQSTFRASKAWIIMPITLGNQLKNPEFAIFAKITPHKNNSQTHL